MLSADTKQSADAPSPAAGIRKRLIIQIQWGPQASHKAILEPGEILRVGRATQGSPGFPAADGLLASSNQEALTRETLPREKVLTVTHDTQMSDAHFALSWNGTVCHLRALKSAMGTQVNGQRMEEAELSHGAWIRAGMTDFMVYIENTTPPRRPTRHNPPEVDAARKHALEVLKRTDTTLFAVLDAARDARLLELLRESVEEYRSLYQGITGDTLADVAPYLVELPKESRLLKALVEEGWGRSWGIYLSSPLPFANVRHQLRKFLMVEAEGMQGQLYFRFYDPRVLRILLPTYTQAQREEFFGGITRFVMEGEDGEVLTNITSISAAGLHNTPNKK